MIQELADKLNKLNQSANELLANPPEWLEDWVSGETFTDLLINNGLQALGIGALGWLVATLLERRHNAQMTEREKLLADVRVSTTRKAGPLAKEGIMISGSVVIAHDFFRTLIIAFRKLIGGNIKPYERLVNRGRREAFIRMREEALLRGFDEVINVRFGSALVAGRFLSAVEMVVYGTGIKSGVKSGAASVTNTEREP